MDETYELPNGKTLHRWTTDSTGERWACMSYGHGPMCRRCQPVDGTLDALLQNAIDGYMEARQNPDTAEFEFKMTDEGNRQAAKLISEITR